MTLGDCQAGGQTSIPGAVPSSLGGLGYSMLLLEPGLKISLGADACSLFGSLQASMFHETHLSIGLRGHGK